MTPPTADISAALAAARRAAELAAQAGDAVAMRRTRDWLTAHGAPADDPSPAPLP